MEFREGKEKGKWLVVMQCAQNCNKIIEMTAEIQHCSPPPPRLTDAMAGPPSPLPVFIGPREVRWISERARRKGRVSCDEMCSKWQ
jgi:hypothetical protein